MSPLKASVSTDVVFGLEPPIDACGRNRAIDVPQVGRVISRAEA
jgi:hypothetical protein